MPGIPKVSVSKWPPKCSIPLSLLSVPVSSVPPVHMRTAAEEPRLLKHLPGSPLAADGMKGSWVSAAVESGAAVQSWPVT